MDFIAAAKNGKVLNLKGRSNSEKWLAADEAYKNGHEKIVIKILGKDAGEEALVEFKSRDFIQYVKKGNMQQVLKMLNDPLVDPAAYENAPLKTAYAAGHLNIVYELMELATVREQLFADCKENLTLDQVKFLLYGFSEKIEDAKFLYEQFLDEEVDDDFEEEEDSEEDSFDDDSEEYETDQEDEGSIDFISDEPTPSPRARQAPVRNLYFSDDEDDEE
jgi:hypothetical protein